MTDEKIISILDRIATALEIQNGLLHTKPVDWQATKTFVWQAEKKTLKPVRHSSALPLNLLKGIDHNTDILMANTEKFARGAPANNALLWGSRGTGKSAIVKSLHKELSVHAPLYLIEINREDISTLPTLLDILRNEQDYRFILFCDDLSFDKDENDYKSLKTVLDGGLEQKPEHIIFYATSNRRHLMPRDMIENERRTGIHPSEAVEEKVSLSDRFGLWLGFYPYNQETYLSMIDAYAAHFGIDIPEDDLHQQALEWSITRGNRSGRVAWQFIQNVRAS